MTKSTTSSPPVPAPAVSEVAVPEVAVPEVAVPEVEAAARAAVTRARQAHASIAVDDDALLRHLLTLVAGESDAQARLERLHAGDVLLAACAAWGEPRATSAVDALIKSAAERVAKTWEPDDVAQYLRVDAWVGATGTPGLLRYRGEGRLSSWLRVAAARFAVAQAQRQRRHQSTTVLERRTDGAPSPEERAAEREHQPALRMAVADAFAALDDEHRELLWRTYVGGATVDALAADLDVHRATAARRVARARDALRDALRDSALRDSALREHAAVEDDALDELLVAAWRELSQSLGTLTRPPAATSNEG